jgi:ubiquinone/menaquinone biosynthesis C-methylase UbiE
VDLSRRSTETELLDTGVPDSDALASLADLRLVNRWLGARAALFETARPFLAASPSRLLDLGCGSGDIPAFVRRRLPHVVAVGLDVKPLHLGELPASVLPVRGDARRLPVRGGAVDVVTLTHFLHHFDDAEAIPLLREVARVSRGAIVVNDLRRSATSHLVARVLLPALLRSPVSVADGLVSIRRGFTAAELEGLLLRAGWAAPRVRRRFPYRLVASATTPGGPGRVNG